MTIPDKPLEQLSRLTGGLAHEIRNPLSTLRVNLQLLAEDLREFGQGNDRLRRSLRRIDAMQNEVGRLDDILNDFIRFVGHHQLDLQVRNINDLIGQLIEFYEPQAASSNVRMMTHLSAEPMPCRIDADLLKQALLNLFINAQQAMPEGGDLMVRTQKIGDRVRIDVSDTGSGIEPAQMRRIFEAYFSTKKGGTGLGLATTERIVTEHGGGVSVESELGKGSNFSIVLPLHRRDEETEKR